MSWTFYPAFLATGISIIGLSRIAYTHHDKNQPRTLSQLAVAEQKLLYSFRNILIICGLLFAVTFYRFILPRTSGQLLAFSVGTLLFAGELLTAVLPAQGNVLRLHEATSRVMAFGMLSLGFAFCIKTAGIYSVIELIFTFGMAALGLLTFLDKQRFIFYELPFIFTSHFSILVAALAVR